MVMYWGDGHMGVAGWLLMVFLWIAAIGGFLFLIRSFGPLRGGSGGSALEILKARYARGEITREEYERMRDDIEK